MITLVAWYSIDGKMLMKNIVVVGAGGFAKEVIWLARDCGYNVKGFLDREDHTHHSLNEAAYLGKVCDWINYAENEFIIAVGSPRARQRILDEMLRLGKPKFATLVHPSVQQSAFNRIDEGCMICAGTILTVDITIGAHTIVNINCTVGHDCIIGSFVTIAPIAAISGNVKISDYCEIGTSAAIKQGISLHRGALLGMGGILVKDIPDTALYLGNPARRVRALEDI